jgi:thioredoxin-like negative regulator of GroEL
MPHPKPQRVLASFALIASLAVQSGCGGSLNRAHEALAVGDEAQAETQLRKALKTKSTHDEAGRLLSVLLTDKAEKIASDEPKKAEDLYREALDLDVRNEAARLGLARLLMKRGFMEEANELLAMKGCHGCGRLVGMMVHQRADNALATGDIMGARQLYQQAFDEGHDPMDALGLVRTYLAPSARDLDAAMAALAAAAPLIAGGQVEAERLFQELRIQLLSAAAAARNNDMVEALFDIKTPVLQDEPEFDLRFRISQAQFRNGDSDPAIARMTHLLETSGQYLEPTQREVMNAALVVMYSARAAQFLQAGDPVGAAKDIAAGLKIDANNSRLKLQQVLAIAANRLPLALTEIEKQTKGKDRTEVEAILHALEVFAYLDEAKMAKAYDALDKAQRLGADLPEVRLARAYVLAESRNEDIKKKDDLKDARQLGGFSYPKGRINQYPGALANLDRARDRVREQGVLHPFRGPGFETRAAALEQKIKAFYPYEVEWYAGKGGMIQIVAKSGQETVEYRGPRWLKGSAVASPGFEAEIPVENPGLVYLEHNGKEIAIVVEANTQIKIEL